jgi:hypothetical protein
VALNVFSITPAHNNARLSLHGDMSLLFDEAVNNKFSIRLFTSTSEQFSLDSTKFQFRDIAGNVVSGIIFGGRPGMFLELMFDPDGKIWYITANNLIGSSGGGNTAEQTLVPATLPTQTPINYLTGMNYRLTLTAPAKLGEPTNMKPGDRLKIVVVQGGTGNNTLTYHGVYGFPDAVIPSVSTRVGAVDVLDCYMTADRTLVCDLKYNYSVVLPLAYANKKFYFNVNSAFAEAQANPVNGQTVRITRSGWRAESTGTVGFQQSGPLNIRVMGVVQADGGYPTLRLDRGNDRPSFGKALINIEGGDNVVIENLGVAGAVSDAGNGTGILINAGAKYTLLKNLYLVDNENGIRSNEARTQQYDLVNVYCDNNGWSIAHAGFSHSIYAGKGGLWRAKSCTFVNSVAGHNIKSRALALVLKQVFCKRSNKARELDCPDQTVLQVSDSVFWKDGDAIQNNLVGLGHEMTDGNNRKQEYFFTNCYFHNDLNADRDVTYVENWFGDGTPNTVPVHFIDCEFGGNIKDKGAAIFKGPYTITLTGGPTGPRVPVGDPRRLFNVNDMDPGRLTNPNNIPLTPFSELPPMTVLDPTPPYPEFAPMDDLPPIPTPGSGGGTTPTTPPVVTPPVDPVPTDTTAPTVSIAASATNVVDATPVVITATAADNVGVYKVEFYKNGLLFDTDFSAPYQANVAFARINNGTTKFTAKAFDVAGNTTVSDAVDVVVNIPAPVDATALVFDSVTAAEYEQSKNNATIGVKRMAGATALVEAFKPSHSLEVYQNGEAVVKVEYSGNCAIENNGTDVKLTLGVIMKSDVLKTADLLSGTWTFKVAGGLNNSRYMTGTVGTAESGANLVLSESPVIGQAFNDAAQFVIPRSIDNLS